MRLSPLIRYNLLTVRVSTIIFFSCYMLGNILANVITLLLISQEEKAEPYATISIIGFVIYGLAVWFIVSYKDTVFYIRRSVSRKEAFISHVITFGITAAILSVLQIISVCIVGFIQYLFGREYLGLGADVQFMQSPDMSNVFVFFVVNFAILMFSFALGYLLGLLQNRWGYKTLGTSVVVLIVFSALLLNSSFLSGFIDFLKFMLTDSSTGLWIVLKQLVAAVIILLISFALMRRSAADKK